MISSCTNPQNNGLMDNIWNAKSRPELISGNYYYYKEIDGYGDPHAITRYHILYMDSHKTVEVCENIERKCMCRFDKKAFDWIIYSDNIVYVHNLVSSPFLALVLYSPKTGHHTLVPVYPDIAASKFDDTGITLFHYDKTGNKPDYANPQMFTAEELGKM